MGGPTGSWTRASVESPREGVESSLSDVLEEIGTVQEQFYLSPRACLGILRRAHRRGKALPEPLETALREKAELGPNDPIPDL